MPRPESAEKRSVVFYKKAGERIDPSIYIDGYGNVYKKRYVSTPNGGVMCTGTNDSDYYMYTDRVYDGRRPYRNDSGIWDLCDARMMLFTAQHGLHEHRHNMFRTTKPLYDIIHIDLDKSNNRLSNLQWKYSDEEVYKKIKNKGTYKKHREGIEPYN